MFMGVGLGMEGGGRELHGAGARLGEGALGAASPPAFHTLAKDISLNKGATRFTLGLRQCIISSFLLQIYLCPPSQNYQVVALHPHSLTHTPRQCLFFQVQESWGCVSVESSVFKIRNVMLFLLGPRSFNL